jgi:N-acyl-D-amino-acid deacylase
MLLIKNGKIIDGTGRAAYMADVLISDDRVSAIGTFPKKAGVEVIDALGLTVTPGFVDPNTDSDHYLTLFKNPGQDDFLLQGVTTIIGGHCGASLAPLLYGSLESIRKWGNPAEINVNWKTLNEFFQVIQNRGLGVNFGTLIGHSTIRRALIGDALRDLTDKELEVFKKIVRIALGEGALGLSTGLSSAHARLTPYQELRELASIVAEMGGVYSTHLRDEKSGLVKSLEETIRLGKETGVKILVSHLRPLIAYDKETLTARNIFRALPEKLDAHFDLYPFDSSLVPIYTLLPEWAKRGNLESMWESILRPERREEFIKELKTLPLDLMTIALAPQNRYLVGKNLVEFAKNQEVAPQEALLRLMILTRMRAVLIVKNIHGPTAEEMIFDARALIGSNGASFSKDEYAMSPERSLRTFPKYLRLAGNREDLSLEEAIKKITYVPAKKFGLRGRGAIKERNFADLTLLRGSQVVHVIINGRVAVRDGAVQPILAGTIIKRYVQ